MKKIIIAAVVILIACAGWARISFLQFQHKVHEKDAHERMEGYSRCVEPLNQSLGSGVGTLESVLEAKRGCSEFWFQTARPLHDGVRDWLRID